MDPVNGGIITGLGKSRTPIPTSLRTPNLCIIKSPCPKEHFDHLTTPSPLFRGHNHKIKLYLETNHKHDIHCTDSPPQGPQIPSCQSIRNNMPADDKIQAFGARGTNADVELPLARFGGEENISHSHQPYFSPRREREVLINTLFDALPDDGRCEMTLLPASREAVRYSWRELYQVATEIESACVRRGKGGYASGLGMLIPWVLVS